MGAQLQIASLGLGFIAAQQQRSIYEMEAQLHRENAEMAKIQASQEERERRQQLRKQLASLGTSMSAQGVALGTSPSVLALEEDERRIANEDIANIKLMGMTNRRTYQLSAKSSEAGATATTLGGFAKTATGIYDIKRA